MIFVDRPRLRQVHGQERITSHLVSDQSLDELHAFARALGLPHKAFHNKPGQPHYDLIVPYIDQAIAAGAQPVAYREIILALRRLAEKSSL